MRILSMTATFGKLEQQTLEFTPGLNVIQAPNEWGKSTWCAFLLAMLYGVDTRAKSTKTALADKERYAPWSGSPMSGRMDILWKDRAVTIERSTRGRIPMGQFRAYETDTGLDIPELTADNCGQQLLGIEQSVYRRAGFIRLADLPITQDDAFRTRLNALVTTGDESGDALALEQKLKDLKNKCRYHRGGLIPQAQAQLDEANTKLRELEELDRRCKAAAQRIDACKNTAAELENHLATLRYRRALREAEAVKEAQEEARLAQEKLTAAREQCSRIPAQQEARAQMDRVLSLHSRQVDLHTRLDSLPPTPTAPELPQPFRGTEPKAVLPAAQQDAARHRDARGRLWFRAMIACPVLFAAACLSVYIRNALIPAIALYALSSLCIGYAIVKRWKNRNTMLELREKYDRLSPSQWVALAGEFDRAYSQYELDLQEDTRVREALAREQADIDEERSRLCGQQTTEDARRHWQEILALWDALANAETDAARTAKQHEVLKSMASPIVEPKAPDSLTLTEAETHDALHQTAEERARLQARVGQYQGRMEALGNPEALRRQAEALTVRLGKLEDTYAALELALDALGAAQAELQRRFAPRITHRGQQILSELTNGKYDRMILSQDFDLHTAARQENVLHDAIWRSDGTIDQLYLALRLAVSEALIPDAPLILDDALVRFDDERLRAALNFLQNCAQTRQVVLFSCQERERRIVEE